MSGTTSNRVADRLSDVKVFILGKTLQESQIGQIHRRNERQNNIGAIAIEFPIEQAGDQLVQSALVTQLDANFWMNPSYSPFILSGERAIA